MPPLPKGEPIAIASKIGQNDVLVFCALSVSAVDLWFWKPTDDHTSGRWR
jgi:hypothetical protein